MAKLTSSLLCLASATLWAASASGEIVFTGQFNRTSGKPDVYIDTFNGPASPGPGWVIQILNGDPGGTNRISSGRFLIDGVDLGPNILNHYSEHGIVVAIPRHQLSRAVPIGS